MTDEVEELLKVLGPFYELVDEKKKIAQISDLSTGWCFLARWIAHTFYFDVEFNLFFCLLLYAQPV